MKSTTYPSPKMFEKETLDSPQLSIDWTITNANELTLNCWFFANSFMKSMETFWEPNGNILWTWWEHIRNTPRNPQNYKEKH